MNLRLLPRLRTITRTTAVSTGLLLGSFGIALAATSFTTTNISSDSLTITGDSTFDTTTLFVDSADDRVGIGLTNPLYQLHVEKNQNASTLIGLKNTTSGTAAKVGFYAIKDGSYGVAMEALSSGFSTSGLRVANHGIIATDISMTALSIFTDGTGDPLIFGTANAERMRIDGSGNVGIGVDVPEKRLSVKDTQSATSIARFENLSTGTDADVLVITVGNANAGSTNNFITFRDNAGGTVVGQIQGAGSNAVAFQTTSDRRIKDNIRDTRYTLDDLLGIKVRDYEVEGTTATGFVAQELYESYPEVVSVGNEGELDWSDPDSIWGVEYGRLTPLLVKAIQDQQVQIESQQEQIDLLKEAVCLVSPAHEVCHE